METTLEISTQAASALASLPAQTESDLITIRLNDWRRAAQQLTADPFAEFSGNPGIINDGYKGASPTTAGTIPGIDPWITTSHSRSDALLLSPEHFAIRAVTEYAYQVRRNARDLAVKMADARLADRQQIEGSATHRRVGNRFVRVTAK